jgi:hypothetical protein
LLRASDPAKKELTEKDVISANGSLEEARELFPAPPFATWQMVSKRWSAASWPLTG